MSSETPWQIWIDTGGTFTDCVARGPGGEIRRCKVLSSGALRDRVQEVDGRQLRLSGGSTLPDGFLTGMELALLGEEVEERAPAEAAIFGPGRRRSS